MLFQGYRTELERCRGKLAELTAIAQEAGEADTAGRARQAAARMQARRFGIAVVGEFKAGKSTLINCLICEEVLPVAAQECTAVVCRIRSTDDGEVPGAELVLAGGKRQSVGIHDVKQYLTVSGANYQGKPVEEAEVRLSSAAWLGTDVEIVDTPGVNASGLARERATLQYLPNADAIVFMTRADSLLTESELIFLRERIITQDAARVFVVVNFADRLRTERDRADVLKRANDLLPPILGHARVHMLSARDARDAVLDGDRAALEASGLPHFQQALEDFLVRDRAAADLGRHLAVIQGVEAQLVRALKQRVQTLSLGDDMRKRRAERIHELMRLAKDDGESIVKSVKSECETLKNRMLSDNVRQARERMNASLKELNARNSDVSESDARQIADRIAGAAHTAVQSDLRSAARKIHGEVAGQINALFGKLDESLGGTTEIVVAEPDYGALVSIHTEQVADEQRVTRKSPKASDVVGTASVGAIIGAFIGGIFLGPAGAWLGAAIGGGFGVSASLDEKPFTETIKTMVSRRRTNAEGAAKNFESQLAKRVEQAVEYLEERTVQDVRKIVRAKQSELEKRLDECDAPTDVQAAASAAHLDSLLRTLRATAPEAATPAVADRRQLEGEA